MSQIIAARFHYAGASRIVDSIKWEDNSHSKTIVGFEVRKSGKFSYRIKRFDLDKISGLEFIDLPDRSGPKIGRVTVVGKVMRG